MKLSIVVPVYNEAAFIDAVLERICAVRFPEGVTTELVVVDDCSTDGTGERLAKWEDKGVRIVRRPVNQGKGAALRAGFAAATGDAIVVQDADFEYDPGDLPALLDPILNDKADVVYGARREYLRGRFTFHSAVNRFLTAFSNLTTGLALTDMECCYKMFRRDLIERIRLCENRFGFEPEFTAKAARLRPRPRFSELPVSYSPRGYEEGKKINWKDGVSALRCIVRYGFGRKS